MIKETRRIKSLFEKLYSGSPWIDVSICDSLAEVSAAQASTHVLKNANSIWEIVNHLISWRENVLKRVQGKVITTPAHNYFLPVSDTSEKAWKKTLKQLETSQNNWIKLLDEFSPADFKNIYPNNGMNYYEHIHGIIQHDAYHLGQIILLKKFI